VAVVGIFLGFSSGAIGICGGGGWGIVPFFIGLAAIPVCGISFVIWIASLIANRIHDGAWKRATESVESPPQ
jgi:hypothetical protein